MLTNVIPTTFSQRDSVVILGAGPSFTENIEKIRLYCKENKSIIIGCNYNYPIKAHYTMFIGRRIFETLKNKIRSKNVIINKTVYKEHKNFVKADKRNYFFVQNSSNVFYPDIHKVEVNENGIFGHWLSNCGFTALLISHFFKPKEVLITGMDGAINGERALRHFNGKKRKFKKWHESDAYYKKKGQFLSGAALDFMFSKNIVVKAFKNDNLWGASRDRFVFI